MAREPGVGVNRRSPIAAAIIAAIILALLQQFLVRADYFLGEDGLRQFEWYRVIEDSALAWWPVFQVASILFSLLLIIGIFYCRHQIIEIRQAERAMLYPSDEEQEAEAPGGLPGEFEVLPGDDKAGPTNPRWEQVQSLVESDNTSDWRQAIMEADIMLEDMLTAMSYEGEGVGEKLKQANKNSFTTLDKAWEAHKIRNAIAHEGASFRIDHRKARHAIDLYRQVFQEFQYI